MPDSPHTRLLALEELRELLDKGRADPRDDLPTRPFERPAVARRVASQPVRPAATQARPSPLVCAPGLPPRSSESRSVTALKICLETVQPEARGRHAGPRVATMRVPRAETPKPRGAASRRPGARAPSLDPAPSAATQAMTPHGKEPRPAVRRRRPVVRLAVVVSAALVLGAMTVVGGTLLLLLRAEPRATDDEGGAEVTDVERSPQVEPALNPGRRAPAVSSQDASSVAVTGDGPSSDVSAQLHDRLHAAVSALSRGELLEARDLYRALAQDTQRHVFEQLSEALERQRACAASEGDASCD